MSRTKHNHKLQTNQRHREEGTHSIPSLNVYWLLIYEIITKPTIYIIISKSVLTV